jgi:hypothetical protein
MRNVRISSSSLGAALRAITVAILACPRGREAWRGGEWLAQGGSCRRLDGSLITCDGKLAVASGGRCVIDLIA